MVLTLVRWLMFTVAMALLPIVFNALRLLTRKQPVSLAEVTSHGELLLVATAISAAAVGELFGSRKKQDARKPIAEVLSSGASIIIMVLSSLYFADVSGPRPAGESFDAALISRTSLLLFIFAVITSGSCILLARSYDEN